MTLSMSQIGDFLVLPVAIPPLPSYPHQVVHHIYVRRSSPPIPTEADTRSLFLINIPTDGTDALLRGLIASLIGNGRVESVTFEDEQRARQTQADVQPGLAKRLATHSHGKKRKRDDTESNDEEDESTTNLHGLLSTWSRPLHRSGGTATVLLVDEKCVELALKAVRKLRKPKKLLPCWGEGVTKTSDPPLGAHWLKAHARLTYPDKTMMQQAIDDFFVTFDRREKEAAELAKRLRSEPDEDGFVTVTRTGRSSTARREEAEEARKKMVEKQEKKKMELGQFYRFQLREKKKAEQAELMRKFQEDRKKVEAMREKRRKLQPQPE